MIVRELMPRRQNREKACRTVVSTRIFYRMDTVLTNIENVKMFTVPHSKSFHSLSLQFNSFPDHLPSSRLTKRSAHLHFISTPYGLF